MRQPQYSESIVSDMYNEQLAAELRAWARARVYLSMQRQQKGKEPLDAALLIEAANRLTGKDR